MLPKAKVHHCFQQHINESMPPRKCTNGCNKKGRLCDCIKCKCRELISYSAADKMVKSGEAAWLVLSKTLIDLKEVCPICAGEESSKKSCQNCGKTGEVQSKRYVNTCGTDIVLVSGGCEDKRGHSVFQSVKSKQTPRTATIDEEHIFQAYVYGKKEQQERIQAYGEMILENLNSLIVPYRFDPTEGDLIFAFGPDDRSESTNWRDGVSRTSDYEESIKEEDNND